MKYWMLWFLNKSKFDAGLLEAIKYFQSKYHQTPKLAIVRAITYVDGEYPVDVELVEKGLQLNYVLLGPIITRKPRVVKGIKRCPVM